jgi:hypothetical protein
LPLCLIQDTLYPCSGRTAAPRVPWSVEKSFLGFLAVEKSFLGFLAVEKSFLGFLARFYRIP